MELYPRGMPIWILIWIRHHVSCIPESELCSRKRQHWLVKVIWLLRIQTWTDSSWWISWCRVWFWHKNLRMFFWGMFVFLTLYKSGWEHNHALYIDYAGKNELRFAHRHIVMTCICRSNIITQTRELLLRKSVARSWHSGQQHNCVIFIQQFRKQEVYTD